MEQEEVDTLLHSLHPEFIISCVRGNVNSQLYLHNQLMNYVNKSNCRLIFLSSANVFDRFTNFPSYEYDKTFSESIYGRFKIKIENALLRLPPKKYVICRIPMIYGYNSPRLKAIKEQLLKKEAIEVFSNVVINATYIQKLTQQIHYIINRRRRGIFHLGSNDLIHHSELVKDIAITIGFENPLLKHVFDSNDDRQLSVLPKDNLLPKHLQFTIDDVVKSCEKPA